LSVVDPEGFSSAGFVFSTHSGILGIPSTRPILAINQPWRGRRLSQIAHERAVNLEKSTDSDWIGKEATAPSEVVKGERQPMLFSS